MLLGSVAEFRVKIGSFIKGSRRRGNSAERNRRTEVRPQILKHRKTLEVTAWGKLCRQKSSVGRNFCQQKLNEII